ncbi:MAG: class I SAM-dependent methyltransferase [Anaerolineae bacterium]
MTEIEWTQETSDIYRQLASIAVPERDEQMAALLILIPFGRNETFRAVELASGEGKLAQALLTIFPNATLLALDGEESMRQATSERLSRFGERAAVAAFDMKATNWYEQLVGADVVYSSLCIHHLDGAEKQALFKAIVQRISKRGAFLIADLVHPQREETRQLYAATYDAATRRQSIEQTGSLALYQQLVANEWNHFATPDPYDKPSPLFDQLRWLHDSGLMGVDCFWLKAGHAVYGGYTGADEASASNHVTYDEALEAAQAALQS